MNGVTADEIRNMVRAAHARLLQHRDQINALNVFPIPDADTGTNLCLTLEAMARAAEAGQEAEAGRALMSLSRAAILGAKGNSGVILAQYLRGFARQVQAEQVLSGASLAVALRAASTAAYGAVDQPVEGTILTVARAAAEAVEGLEDADPYTVLQRAAEAARRAVEETPRQLPVLAQAGVVDAAGLGLSHMLAAMGESLRGGATEARADSGPAAGPAGTPEDRGYGYEVQFVLEGEGLDREAVRQALHPLGESLVVVGDEGLLKVHIHTPTPQPVLEAAARFGTPQDVTVDSLDEQILALHRPPEEG